jgi:AcrR family transcriptional regulator
MPRARAESAADTSAATTDEEQRKAQILEAAMQCFVQLGISKTSVQDVARMARVSRGTVYRYFEDRQRLIDAAIEFGSRQYYDDAAKAMASKPTLAAQAAAFAEVAARMIAEHRTRNRLAEGDEALLHRYAADTEGTLRRTTSFLLPYVEAAKERGEVGRDVDPKQAAEGLARLIMSITTTQVAVSFDMSKPKAVARFFEQFAVNGLR